MSQQIEPKEQTPTQSIEPDTSYTEMAYSKPGSYTVATIFTTPQKQINLMDLKVSDLSNLKEDDPFLYYSIPAVRKTAIHGFVINKSITDRTASSWNSRSPLMRSISFESFDGHDHMEVDENDETVDEDDIPFCQVTRRSCISFEGPNIMIPDDLYISDNLASVSESPGDENDEEDCILSFLLDSGTNLSFDE